MIAALIVHASLNAAWGLAADDAPAFREAPDSWPISSSIRRTKGQRQVLLFTDPYAFETRSAIYRAVELSATSGAACTVCLVGPPDATTEWFDTPLAWTASRNGLGLYRDVGGREARRFGALNTGVCLAFDARGKLCFYGEITSQPSDDSYDAGVKAAVDALAHIRAEQDALVVRPVLGKTLLD